MNKKIILGLTTAALLATSAIACNGHQKMNQGSEKNKTCNIKNSNRHDDSHMFVKMIMKLNLTDKQRAEVLSIVKENMQSMPNLSDAFSDSTFDKKEFMRIANERREAKVERKTDMIEKIYKILNSSQKKDLKTMLDMKDIVKKQISTGEGCYAKNCNG